MLVLYHIVNKYLFHNNPATRRQVFHFLQNLSQNPVMFFIIFFKCQVYLLQIGSIMKNILFFKFI